MRYSVAVVLLFMTVVTEAQDVLPSNAPYIKWYQLNTPGFKVLYPEGFELQAQRMANTFEHIRAAEARTLRSTPRKISVLLQNQSAISNGFVSIIPRRSEFYTMPPQDYNFGGTNDWLNQLATHEYRHIVQYKRANTGFSKALYYLFGPATLAAVSHVAVPDWFWEGDAVATETAFTHSGRGRIPNFNLLLRTNLQEGRSFNYHKQYLGSYKHNISDHYVLGYHMVGYLRKRTNDPFSWDSVTKRSFNFPFIPFTFSNAIRKESGLYVTQLYKEMVKDLQQTWSEQTKSLTYTAYASLVERNTKAYTSYSYPQVLADGSVLTMKAGIGDIAQFVVLKDGEERRVFIPGQVNDTGMLSAAGNVVVWNEYNFDPRWPIHTFSVIRAFDVQSKRNWLVTKNSRYAGAALSPDAKLIATVESDYDYKVSLVVIDTQYGNVIKKFPNSDDSFYSMPRWSADGKKIVALKTKNYFRSVVVIDYASGSETTIIEPTRENIGHPVLTGNYLFYNSAITGIDNIFVLNLETKERKQVTSARYGAYNPGLSADGKTIYYNNQSRDGLNVVSIPVEPSSWNDFVASPSLEYDAQLTEQEGRPTLFDSIPAKQYPAKKYSKLSGIINPISWGAYFNSTFTQADIGLTSQDILSTTTLTAGYVFDIYERTGAWKAKASYHGLYPVLEAQVLFGKREDNFSAFGNSVSFTWEETAFEAGARIPWNFTKSKFFTGLEIGNNVGITNVTGFQNTVTDADGAVVYQGPERAVTFTSNDVDYIYIFRDQLTNGALRYNKAHVSFYNFLKRSHRDIASRWAQFFELDWYQTGYGSDFGGSLIAMRSGMYFPGLAKHHSLHLRFDHQTRALGESRNLYSFRNAIFRPRGFGYPLDRTFTAFAVNYALPLWYPDISLGPLLNVQRVKTNLFYDIGQATGLVYVYGVNPPVVAAFESNNVFKSTGAELKFDFNLFRFKPKFEVGFRYVYLFPTKFSGSDTVFEFLIGNIGF